MGMCVHNRYSQQGFTLVMSLVMLVLISIVGLGAARYAGLDQLASRAARDREIAFQGAEAALRDAMLDIESGLRASLFDEAPMGFSEECPTDLLPTDATAAAANTRGLCLAREAVFARQLWQDVDLDQRAVPYGTFTQRAWNTAMTPAPVYIIETVPLMRAGMEVSSAASGVEQLAFRITAVGFGPPESDTQVALQSFYVKTL